MIDHHFVFVASRGSLEGVATAVLSPALSPQERLALLGVPDQPMLHHLTNHYFTSDPHVTYWGGYLQLTAEQWTRLQALLAKHLGAAVYARIDFETGVLVETNIVPLDASLGEVVDIRDIARLAGLSIQ